MICTEPNVVSSARYGVLETAAILAVNRTTIFRYEQGGYLKPGYRKANHKKFFSGAEILRFWRSQM